VLLRFAAYEPFMPLGKTMKEDTAQIDERRFALDAEIQRREIALKEMEAKRGGLTASQATIAGALLALISGVLGAFIAAWSSQNIETGKSLTSLQIEELKAKGNLDLERSKQLATEALERKKFETSLILEAIKTPSRTDAIRNLKFFVSAGFVDDPDGKISKLGDDSLPSIGTPSAESASRAIRATGRIQVVSEDGAKFLCTGVAVSPQHVITASFCVGGSIGKAATTKVEFNNGGRTYPLRLVSQQEQSKLALLKVDSTATLDTFLDRTRIRDPLLGERIYFALALANQESIQLLTCEVSTNPATENDFEHNCPTGGGSAGAILIAVSDNALLGIHHSRKSTGGDTGTAAKLLRAVTALSAFLPPIGSSQPNSR
jgi:hypothetical protein